MGQLIEAGNYDELASLAARDPEVMQMLEGAATHLPGAKVPDYLLKSPSGLSILQNSMTVESMTPLSRLLSSGQGHLDWAACTEFLR